MRFLLSVLVFSLPVSGWSAPPSGLKESDTFLFGYVQTWSSNYFLEKESGVEICILAAVKAKGLASSERQTGNVLLRSITRVASGTSPCANFLRPGEAFVSVQRFATDAVKEPARNKYAESLGIPLQRTFESRLNGKAINDAYQKAQDLCPNDSCAFSLVIAHNSPGTAMEISFPLREDGNDMSLESAAFHSETGAPSLTFEITNYYAKHVSNL